VFSAEQYTYRVRWSQRDGEYVATIAEFPSLSWLAENQMDAFTGAVNLVRETLEDMAADGETPPLPFGQREYSGEFVIRTTPEVHRRLAIEAAEQKVSLNRLANTRLVGA